MPGSKSTSLPSSSRGGDVDADGFAARVAVAAVAVVVALTGCTSGPEQEPGTMLARGDRWELVVSEGPTLAFHRDGQQSSEVRVVSEYRRPPTLDEATSFLAERDADEVTLVAGPVHTRADEVMVEAGGGGGTVTARLVSAHGWSWFWAALPGARQVDDITAYDQDGAVVDEFTLPPMPPPGAPPAP